MSAVPTETICRGDTSMSWTSSPGTYWMSVVAPKKMSRSSWRRRSSSEAACGERRTSTRSSAKEPSGFTGVFAWATTYSSSSSAARYRISSVTLPSMTRRYGDSMKPNSLTRAKVARAPMRPMFGPSGVSIGHMRP